MEETKLWWLVKDESQTFRFVLASRNDIVWDSVLSLDYEAEIVHPDNPIYPESLRAYNREHRNLIDSYLKSSIKVLLRAKATDSEIAAEPEASSYSSSGNILRKWRKV